MIKIKTPEEIEAFKKAGALSKSVLRHAGKLVKPGVSTRQIDEVVERLIRMHGGVPGFKGLYGFPSSICASPNEMIIHGIPSDDTVLQDGDILSIDTGATVDGWVGDNAWTFYCGTVSTEVQGLCECTRDCLKAGIAAAVPGNHVGDIGFAVQQLAESNGYGVVREFVGHGVGRVMHEDPNVPNYGKRGRGPRLEVGMTIAIEPMITLGSPKNRTLADGWGVVTRDGKAAAHYENSIAITADGPVILTQDAEGPWCTLQGGE